jgi:mono/diheme cytochrome c family protein
MRIFHSSIFKISVVQIHLISSIQLARTLLNAERSPGPIAFAVQGVQFLRTPFHIKGAPMLKPVLFVAALAAGGVLQAAPSAPDAATPVTPAVFTIPPASSSMVNSAKPTAESRTHAKKVYGYDCAVCHGEDGAGTGDLAKHMKAPMPDFRDATALKSRSDGDLFYIIKNGKGEMEGEGERLKPEDTWNLVNYVRSFSKMQATSKPPG